MNRLKAIIMAGGEGSRLRPLTCDCPKPMLRLMGKPLMEYAVRLLQRHGITEIGATLGYLPNVIMDYFDTGERFGAHLHYYIEKKPLGTAGSVKQAESFLNERFIVLSGDGVTDFDLSAALHFHKEQNALATLLLVKSAHPQEYGMVVTDSCGRIRSFHEKPGRSDVYSELINTGVYILEPEILRHIPKEQFYDFGHDLFPALVASGAPVYGYVASGYWCDVGDAAAYLRVHADALDGKIALPDLHPCTDGAILEPGCIIEAPVYIAPGAHVCPDSHIGPYSVLGEGCFIAPGASVKCSLIFCGARIEAGAQLRGCIIGEHARINEGAQLFEESAVGSASCVGERAILPPGIKIWPEKTLPGGERPESNIVWGSRRTQRFINGALQLETPAQATRTAEACAAYLHPRELVLGRGASCMADAMYHAVAAGIMAHGVQILDAGVCSPSLLRHALSLLHGDAALLVESNTLTPLNAHGALLSERNQRDILKLLERQDFSMPFAAVTRPIHSADGLRASYVAETAAAFTGAPTSAPKIVLCAEGSTAALSEQIFMRAGLQIRSICNLEALHPVRNEIGVYLPDNGETALLCSPSGILTEVERQIACAWTALEQGERKLLLPVHATRAIETLAQRYGAQTRKLAGEDALWMDALAKEAPRQFRLQFDGLYFALTFLSTLIARGLSLDRWKSDMPTVCRSVRGIHVPIAESGRLLHHIAQEDKNAQLGGGICINRKNGWAWLGLDARGTQLNIIAEGADMEASEEICNFYDSEITRLLQSKD